MYFVSCPKRGLEMEVVVLLRVGFLDNFCPKQGQDFKPSAAPLYPIIGQVPTPPPPPDSGEESCSQPALTLTLILSYMYFLQGYSKPSGSSADAEIVEGVRPNQEPLSLSARIFFFPRQVELFLFSLGRCFFRFLYPRTFFLLIFL